MRTRTWRLIAAILAITCVITISPAMGEQVAARTVLLEVVRNTWDVERVETLVYLRVYSDGFAEAHPMREVDFRDIEYKKKNLPGDELRVLKILLNDPTTEGLLAQYSSFWGNKNFGYKYDVTMSSMSYKHIELINFQPFLARNKGKPYPAQLEKVGCSIWKLRAEVSGEALEKDWLRGCADLGY